MAPGTWETSKSSAHDYMNCLAVAWLLQVLYNVTFGSIITEDREELTPHHFTQLIPLAQCCLDYMLFQANASGATLVGG